MNIWARHPLMTLQDTHGHSPECFGDKPTVRCKCWRQEFRPGYLSNHQNRLLLLMLNVSCSQPLSHQTHLIHPAPWWWEWNGPVKQSGAMVFSIWTFTVNPSRADKPFKSPMFTLNEWLELGKQIWDIYWGKKRHERWFGRHIHNLYSFP